MGDLQVNRTYLLNDADLCMYIGNLVNTIKRDAEQFEDFGVSLSDIDAFKALGDEFENFPDDIYYSGDVSIAVEDKLVKLDELRVAIRNITVRAENKWGANSALYKKFGVTGMNKMNERDMFVAARRVHYVATGLLSELASEGLTIEILNSFAILCQEYEDAMNAVKDAQALRDLKTEERIALGNRLYALATKYRNIGKQIWESVSESKYNDYLIYPGPSGISIPIPPSKLKYVPDKNLVKWSKAGSASTFQLMYKLKDSEEDFKEFYSGRANKTPFQPAAGDYLLKVRGHNAKGYGEFCAEIEVSVVE